MRNTIKQYKHFLMPDDGPTFICPGFIARARPTLWPGDAKYGITVTKKTFKRAVDRNRAKRLIRVWLRANEKHMSPDLDYRFIARAGILDMDLETGVNYVKRALKSLSDQQETGERPYARKEEPSKKR